MRRVLIVLLGAIVGVVSLTTTSIAKPKPGCKELVDGSTMTFSTTVIDHRVNEGGGTNIIIKIENPCDVMFEEIVIGGATEKIEGCRKGDHIDVTGKVSIQDTDLGEMAFVTPTAPPVCK